MLCCKYVAHAFPLLYIIFASWPSSVKPGAVKNGNSGKGRGSGAATVKLPMLRVSHCQTALFGNRGGGRGGGGRAPVWSPAPRDECSEAAVNIKKCISLSSNNYTFKCEHYRHIMYAFKCATMYEFISSYVTCSYVFDVNIIIIPLYKFYNFLILFKLIYKNNDK